MGWERRGCGWSSQSYKHQTLATGLRTPVGVAGSAGSSLKNRPKMKLRTQQHMSVAAEYPPRGPPPELFSGLM